MNKLDVLPIDKACLRHIYYIVGYANYTYLRPILTRNPFTDYLFGGPYRVKEELS